MSEYVMYMTHGTSRKSAVPTIVFKCLKREKVGVDHLTIKVRTDMR